MYGTWVTSIFAVSSSSSTSSRAGEPGPTIALFSAPGLARASASRSFTLFAGTAGCTTSTSGPRTSSEIGARSFTVS